MTCLTWRAGLAARPGFDSGYGFVAGTGMNSQLLAVVDDPELMSPTTAVRTLPLWAAPMRMYWPTAMTQPLPLTRLDGGASSWRRGPGPRPAGDCAGQAH